MRNYTLWDETIDILLKYDKSWDDVVAIETELRRISKEDFNRYASKIVYDRDYGLNYIDLTLKIIGNDFVMVREEDDGKEWWRFISTRPKRDKPSEHIVVDHLLALGVRAYCGYGVGVLE